MKHYGRWYLKADEFQRIIKERATPKPQDNMIDYDVVNLKVK